MSMTHNLTCFGSQAVNRPHLGTALSQQLKSGRRSTAPSSLFAPRATSKRPFSDFLEPPSQSPSSDSGQRSSPPPPAETKADELIDRTAALLSAARNALAEVRSREPSDSRHRRTGPTITAIASAGDRGTLLGGRKPAPTTLAFAWESDDDEDNTDEVESFTSPRGSADNGLPPPPITGGGGAGFSGGMGSGPPGSLDSWFGDKVDTGGMQLRAAAMKPAGVGVAVLDRPDLPTSLEFAPPEAPVESGAATIFPESISLRFHSETSLDEYEEEASAVDVNVPSAEKYERTSGEEYGPDGYWYRWTEIRGQDATGAVQWSERWWDVSDWRGMKEKGAEKWGTNDRGDAWRETWREAISIDDAAGQPKVERSAHKWARAAGQQEWEEKWSESYWSGGKTEKWADKWGRDAGDVWHERWGESYDGKGGCVKWTDRWAERPSPYGGYEKWGDKWEERFGDGKGTKTGETWSESGAERYQRWWGENHFGDGYVQKFGHSTTGEHWDTTEHMDTYYNPIPHFGYDLALAHSPQLREVPILPRDDPL